MTDKIPEAMAVLDRLEWAGHSGRRCPICAGWDNSPTSNGATDHRHTKDCEFVKARAAFLAEHEALKILMDRVAFEGGAGWSDYMVAEIALAAVETLK